MKRWLPLALSMLVMIGFCKGKEIVNVCSRGIVSDDSIDEAVKKEDGAKPFATAEEKAKASAREVEAQFHYAEMLRDGRGVAKNVREAVRWTRRAADGSLAAAQCQMGLFYMNGLGVDYDEDKAVEWLNKAASQHHAQAQYNLGIYYAKFFDRESARQAVKWLNEAAKQDYADAQYNLAHLYLNPHHPASREDGAGHRAISLLTRAVAQGHSAAKAKLEELGCTTSQSQEKLEELKQCEPATFINNVF